VDTTTLQDALAKYVRIVGTSADSTHETNNRPLYDLHLAQAARLFADLRAGDMAAVRERVADESRAFALTFLAGRDGEAAERAWHAFASLVEAP
jgi:hypothetical protein